MTTLTPTTPRNLSAKSQLNAGKNDMVAKSSPILEPSNEDESCSAGHCSGETGAVELDERGLRIADVGGKKVHVCCAQFFDEERERGMKRAKNDLPLMHHPLCRTQINFLNEDDDIPELIYFDGPGRGELVRLILHAGGVVFRDRRITFREFVAMKGDPSSLPMQRFGSVPILSHKGMVLAQSIALQQYASDLASVNREVTPQMRAINMMYAATHAEVQTAMYACMFGTDEAKRKARENLPIVVEKFIGSIDATLPDNGDYVHGGEDPSLADLAIFDMCTSKFPGLLMLGEDISRFTKVVALVHKIREHEPLRAYLSLRGF